MLHDIASVSTKNLMILFYIFICMHLFFKNVLFSILKVKCDTFKFWLLILDTIVESLKNYSIFVYVDY